MKKIKKGLASTIVFLSIASTVCSPISAFADTTENNTLYVRTATIPNDIEVYAYDIFSRFSYNVMQNLGFSEAEYKNMELGHAFTITAIEDVTLDFEQYYFPVLNNNTVIATLTVNQNIKDNSMGFQFGKNDLSISLNEITSSLKNPVSICMNNEACFAIDSMGNATVMYSFNDSSAIPVIDIDKTSACFFNNSEVAIIGNDNVYNKINKSISADPTFIGLKFDVPFVDNKNATCWASCVGSLASYYKNPSTGGTATEAANFRDKAIKDYPNPDINSVVDALKSYSNVTLTASEYSLSWETLKSQIAKKNPFYSTWITTVNGQSAHALVVNGYIYDKNSPTNSEYYAFYVMDCNKPTSGYQLISFNGTYSINRYPYTWDKTVYKK